MNAELFVILDWCLYSTLLFMFPVICLRYNWTYIINENGKSLFATARACRDKNYFSWDSRTFYVKLYRIHSETLWRLSEDLENTLIEFSIVFSLSGDNQFLFVAKFLKIVKMDFGGFWLVLSKTDFSPWRKEILRKAEHSFEEEHLANLAI